MFRDVCLLLKRNLVFLQINGNKTRLLDLLASKLLQSHITGKQALLITNDRIAPMYLERYKTLLEQGGTIQVHTLVLPDGEENKSLEVMGMILDKALKVGLDRKATFVALGGGVIGDMVGFASAIYLRGVNFIQVRNLRFLTFDFFLPMVFLKHQTLLLIRSLQPSWPWSTALLAARQVSTILWERI